MRELAIPVLPHVPPAQHGRQVLPVDDVLPLCHQDPPSVLEQGLIVQRGVGIGAEGEVAGKAVVLP